MECIPFETAAIGAYPTKQAWDAAATDLVATMLDRWRLTAAEPFVGGESGAVLRATTAAGVPAVLKVGFPHVEAIHEAVALEAWGPGLAPAVLRQDAWMWALLLEEVVPGIPLSRWTASSEDAVAVGAQLLARLAACTVPETVPAIGDVMRPFLETARRTADDLVAAGLAEFIRLLDTSATEGFVHGDFNPGNILLGADGWVTIDAKPMRGDPAFDLWPLVAQLGSPDHAARLGRLHHAASVAGIDVERAARWAFARSALNVSWLRESGASRDVDAAVREATAWQSLTGAL